MYTQTFYAEWKKLRNVYIVMWSNKKILNNNNWKMDGKADSQTIRKIVVAMDGSTASENAFSCKFYYLNANR